MFSHFSKNGRLLPIEEATIPLSNIEYTYGFGVYENLRVHHGKILFLDDHLDRLLHSAKVIELQHALTKNVLSAWTEDLVKHLPDGVFNLKMLLIGARNPEDCLLFIIPLSPLFPEKKLYTQGATAITYMYERAFPQAKTLNMLGSYVAYRKAKEHNCYDALLIDRHGHIVEGTRTNFFAIKGTTIFMPPMEEILEGVTLKHVLEVAKANNFSVEETDIHPGNLSEFDGAFLTSTSSKIVPLRKIDTFAYAEISEHLRILMGKFDDFLQENLQKAA